MAACQASCCQRLGRKEKLRLRDLRESLLIELSGTSHPKTFRSVRRIFAKRAFNFRAMGLPELLPSSQSFSSEVARAAICI